MFESKNLEYSDAILKHLTLSLIVFLSPMVLTKVSEFAGYICHGRFNVRNHSKLSKCKF